MVSNYITTFWSCLSISYTLIKKSSFDLNCDICCSSVIRQNISVNIKLIYLHSIIFSLPCLLKTYVCKHNARISYFKNSDLITLCACIFLTHIYSDIKTVNRRLAANSLIFSTQEQQFYILQSYKSLDVMAEFLFLFCGLFSFVLFCFLFFFLWCHRWPVK